MYGLSSVLQTYCYETVRFPPMYRDVVTSIWTEFRHNKEMKQNKNIFSPTTPRLCCFGLWLLFVPCLNFEDHAYTSSRWLTWYRPKAVYVSPDTGTTHQEVNAYRLRIRLSAITRLRRCHRYIYPTRVNNNESITSRRTCSEFIHLVPWLRMSEHIQNTRKFNSAVCHGWLHTEIVKCKRHTPYSPPHSADSCFSSTLQSCDCYFQRVSHPIQPALV